MKDTYQKLNQGKKFHWTNHIIEKMKYYRISPSMIRRVIRFPERVEEGIVKNTIASMKVNKLKKKREEIWVMYQRKIKNKKSKIKNNNKLILITAWRYPGKSPERNPIPKEIVEEIKEILKI